MIVVAHPARRLNCQCCDAITLHLAGGGMHVYAAPNIPARLAAALSRFVREAVENPSLIAAIAMAKPSSLVTRHTP